MSVARAAPSFGPTARAWLPLGEVVRWGELGHKACGRSVTVGSQARPGSSTGRATYMSG